MKPHAFSIATFAKKFFWVLVVVQLVFVVLEAIHFTLKQRFHEQYEPSRDSLFTLHSLQYEDSVGTWLSVMTNMLVAVVVFLIFKNAPKEFKWRRMAWLVGRRKPHDASGHLHRHARTAQVAAHPGAPGRALC